METTNSNANSHYKRLLDRLLLPFLLLLTPIIYLANARYNLPVSANVDERTSLEVLSHFHAGGLNPHFFEYPTLYYYVTYVFTKPFSFNQILFWGRELNLAFVGLTAYLGYLFCRDNFKSRWAGLLAAGFIVASPTIIGSGSYLCTDALLAVGTMASLLFMTRYFAEPSLKIWLLSMAAIGLSVGCKYTAFLLFIVYIAAEMMWEFGKTGNPESAPLPSRIGRTTSISIVAFIGLALFLSGLLFPTAAAIRFAFAHHTQADVRSADYYAAFFKHIRVLLMALGFVVLLLGPVIWKSEVVYRLISKTRVYWGLAIVLLIALVTTPYSVITPAKFLYDLGALARSNILPSSGHIQWSNYVKWALENESGILVFVGLVGLVVAARKHFWQYRLVLVFTAIYMLTIGFSRVGFPRYLTPILPVLFVFASAVFIPILIRPGKERLVYLKVVSGIMLILVCGQLWVRLLEYRASIMKPDAFRQSYDLASKLRPQQVFFAGFAPSVELQLAGYYVKQVSWASMGKNAIGQQMTCGDLLIYDLKDAGDNSVSASGDPSVQVLLNDASGDGQVVLEKAGCGQASLQK